MTDWDSWDKVVLGMFLSFVAGAIMLMVIFVLKTMLESGI